MLLAKCWILSFDAVFPEMKMNTLWLLRPIHHAAFFVLVASVIPMDNYNIIWTYQWRILDTKTTSKAFWDCGSWKPLKRRWICFVSSGLLFVSITIHGRAFHREHFSSSYFGLIFQLQKVALLNFILNIWLYSLTKNQFSLKIIYFSPFLISFVGGYHKTKGKI